MLYVITVCLIEYRGFSKRRREYKELEHFAEFLSNLNYEFYLCKSITESIFRAAESVPENLKRKLEELCIVLEDDSKAEVWEDFKVPKHMKSFKLFAIQCRNALQYGSGKSGEASEFTRNMTELRRDVQNECYKRAQAGFLFAGMGLVSALSIAFLPLIKQWGCKNMSNLGKFYNGSLGQFTSGILCIVALCCYGFVALIRSMDKTVYKRPAILNRIYDGYLFQKISEKYKGCNMEKRARVRLHRAGIYRNGMEYWCSCIAAAVLFMSGAGWFLREKAIQWVLLGMVLSGVLGGIAMAGVYRYLGYLRELGMSGEVLGLQSVIMLVYNVPNMTLSRLLEILEEYGEVFRRSLAECADRYSYEESDALTKMREGESDMGFRQLAGRIAVSEQIGLKRAFSELAADRLFFREQQRLDTEQELRKKAANAQFFAFAPMMLILFAYLIIPFLISGFVQMSDIFTQMQQIRQF